MGAVARFTAFRFVMTAAELITLWRIRDARYTNDSRRYSLSDAEVAGIRAYRMRELVLVDAIERAAAYVAFYGWRRPK